MSKWHTQISKIATFFGLFGAKSLQQRRSPFHFTFKDVILHGQFPVKVNSAEHLRNPKGQILAATFENKRLPVILGSASGASKSSAESLKMVLITGNPVQSQTIRFVSFRMPQKRPFHLSCPEILQGSSFLLPDNDECRMKDTLALHIYCAELLHGRRMSLGVECFGSGAPEWRIAHGNAHLSSSVWWGTCWIAWKQRTECMVVCVLCAKTKVSETGPFVIITLSSVPRHFNKEQFVQNAKRRTIYVANMK